MGSCNSKEKNQELKTAEPVTSNERFTELKKIGKCLPCRLGNEDSVTRLLLFLKNNQEVTWLKLSLPYPPYSARITLTPRKIVESFADSEYTMNITELALYGGAIGPEGIKALSRSRYLKNISTLTISGQEIGLDGIKSLCHHESYFKNLVMLELDSNWIDDESMNLLSCSENFKSLRDISLSNNEISDYGIKALFSSQNLGCLHTIDLSNNRFGREGIKYILDLDFDLDHDLKWKVIKINDVIDERDIDDPVNIDIECLLLLATYHNEKQHTISWNSKFLSKTILFGLEIEFGDEYDGGKYEIGEPIFDWMLNKELPPNTKKLDQDSIKDLIFDMAPTDEKNYVVRYIINNCKRLDWPFIINSKNANGNTISSFYNNSPKMQRFLFENGLIPQHSLPEGEVGTYHIQRENVIPFVKYLSDELILHSECHAEYKKTLRHLISGALDIAKPEEITFEQQALLSIINTKCCSPIVKNVPSRSEYKIIIEELVKVKRLQEYVLHSSSND